MGHPNLSPALNVILDATRSPDKTLDLRTVHVGDVVDITLGKDARRSFLSFRIEKPAGPGMSDHAVGTVLKTEFGTDIADDLSVDSEPFPIEGKQCQLVAACTKNENSPLGMTMVAIGRITQGRNFLWGVLEWKDRWILFETVTNWELTRA